MRLVVDLSGNGTLVDRQ